MNNDEADRMLLNNSWSNLSDAIKLLQKAYSMGYDQHQSKIEQLTRQRDALLEALISITDCCNEEHAVRDYASRQTEIRGIAQAAINAVKS